MKRVFVVFSICAFISICVEHVIAQEQELFVEYDFYTHGTFEKVELTANWKNSYSKTIEQIQEWGDVSMIKNCSDVYKDFSNHNMFWEEYAGHVTVKDSLDFKGWDIASEEKEILGFKCFAATCKYHGREYKAWFTNELPFRAAPWRFNGLPGVLLEVKSKDEFLSAEAKIVKIRDAKEPLKNPFKIDRCMNWEKFTQVFISRQKKLDEDLQKISVQSNINIKDSFSLRIDLIEY